MNILDDLSHIFQTFLLILAFYMGYRLGSGTVTEVYHIYKQDSGIEIPTDEEGKPSYNKSVPDPDYAAWYNKNR